MRDTGCSIATSFGDNGRDTSWSIVTSFGDNGGDAGWSKFLEIMGEILAGQ